MTPIGGFEVICLPGAQFSNDTSCRRATKYFAGIFSAMHPFQRGVFCFSQIPRTARRVFPMRKHSVIKDTAEAVYSRRTNFIVF
jgi:hypothetical protein